MIKSLRFSQIAFYAALLGGAAYLTSFAIFLLNDVRPETSVSAALTIASHRPGVFGMAYLLQALAFMLWALVPISSGQVFRQHAPGVSQLAAITGGFAFAWRALADFAKGGSMEYLGQAYGSSDPMVRVFAEQLATWTQLWTFGAVWELVGNGFGFGVFAFLCGLLLVAAGRNNLGWTVTFFGGLAGLSWLGTAVYYVIGVRSGLFYVGLPGFITLVVGPAWLGWIAWYSQRLEQRVMRAAQQASAADAIPQPAS